MKPQQILNKLAKYNEVQKVELSSEEPIKVEFAIVDDLSMYVVQVNKNMETADRVIESANNVNQAIQRVQDDARYYNKYKDVVTQDLKQAKNNLEKMLQEAEKAAKSLGVDIKLASPHYSRGQAALADIQQTLNTLNKVNLNFDI